jgi:hypothetical protein
VEEQRSRRSRGEEGARITAVEEKWSRIYAPGDGGGGWSSTGGDHGARVIGELGRRSRGCEAPTVVKDRLGDQRGGGE